MKKLLVLICGLLTIISLSSCDHYWWDKKEVPVEKTDTIIKQDSVARVSRLQERANELQERQCLDTYYSIPDMAFMAILMKTGEDASKVAIVSEYNSNKVYYDGIVLATYAQKGVQAIRDDSIEKAVASIATPKK
jgi:hypothetical protein